MAAVERLDSIYYILWCVFVAVHAGYIRCHIVIWGLLYNIFPNYLTECTNFEGKKKLLTIRCVFLFSLQILSKIFPIPRRTERDTIKMYICLHAEVPLFLSDFNETWIFPTYVREIFNMKFHKTRPVGTELFHVDWLKNGRTERKTKRQTWRS